MLAQAQQAADEVKAIDRGTTGILNVAATSSVLFSGLSTAIAAFKAENQNVEVIIHELSPKEQIERLELHPVDACFLRFAPDEKNFLVTRAWREKVGLIVPPGHKLASRKSVRIASLRDENFVFYRLPDSAFATHLQSICVQEGFAPRIIQQVVESFSVVSLVSAGLGIGFVPETVGSQQRCQSKVPRHHRLQPHSGRTFTHARRRNRPRPPFRGIYNALAGKFSCQCLAISTRFAIHTLSWDCT